MSRIFIIGLFLCFAFIRGYSQTQISVGSAYSSVGQKYLAGDIDPQVTFSTTAHFTIAKMWDQKLALTFGTGLARKGYTQILEEIEYNNRFVYLSFPVALSYRLFSFASLQIGVTTNLAIYSRQKVNGVNFRLARDFKRHEFAGMAKLNFLNNHKLGFYIGYQHSLLPLMDYHQIDAEGNFIRSIKDVRFQFFQLGINLNLRKE